MTPFLLLALFLTSCKQETGGRILSPDVSSADIQWTQEELEKGVARRLLKSTPHASYHAVRLRTIEAPHVHERHDVTVFVLKGRALMQVDDREFQIRTGDVVEIPRGVVHAAENQDPQATEVYAIFTPPFDGKDHRPVD